MLKQISTYWNIILQHRSFMTSPVFGIQLSECKTLYLCR
jgi:hypothetical protein